MNKSGLACDIDSKLRLSPATPRDAALLLQWRNDPETRAASKSDAPVTAEEHAQFMAKWTTRNGREGLFLLLADGEPVGTGRIEYLNPTTCQLSYCIAPAARHQGYGVQLVRLLATQAQRWGYATVACRIKRGNTASLICAMQGGVNSVQLI